MKQEKNMRNLMSFLLIGVIFVSAIAAQNSVVPIVYSETLLGGAQNGKWITAKKTDEQLSEKTEFNIVNLNVVKKEVIVGTKEDDRGECENPRITFERPEDYDTNNPPFLLGANAKWNPVPRIPQKLLLPNKTYTKIVADFLKTKGIAKTKIEITQAFRIDLENDGQNEIIITGSYYKKGLTEEQNASDYAFALLRKTVNGKPRNILLGGNFFTPKLLRSGEFAPPNIYEITAIADLNGDGKMEIVLADLGYEAHSDTIFEMKNGKPIKVLEAECYV